MKCIVEKENGVSFITVENDNNLTVTLCSTGAGFYSMTYRGMNMLLTPSKREDFYRGKSYHGKLVGRFSGRIKDARCQIDGVTYELDKNWHSVNSLHGGNDGISYANFDAKTEAKPEYTDVVFTYVEKENKLPGDVSYVITYRIYRTLAKVDLLMHATTTKKTVVNLTNHAYFNLNGNQATVLEETLQLNCNRFGELDTNLICERLRPVDAIMDFTKAHPLKDHIYDPYLVDHTAFGYDHFWLKTDEANPVIAILKDNLSKVQLTVSTSYPAIVVYTNNYKTNCTYLPNVVDEKHQAVCLECQFVPNGINMTEVDPALLAADEEYNHYITYEFEDLK